jgi:adenosylcobinamide-phosphate synthase
MNTRRRKVLCLALLLDLALGDPSNRFHPVAWMGSAIATAKRYAPRRSHHARLAYGSVLVVGGALTVASLSRRLERLTAGISPPWNWLIEAGLLKMTISVRGLGSAAAEVKAALEASDLPEARRLVGWHLVSRDTMTLSATQVAAATVESVAENTSDGIVAPLFYYSLGGLPAAVTYRFINTTDSMLGYRDSVHEWLGKAPALLDDLVNLLPARLTAMMFILAAALTGKDAHRAWRVWRRDSRATASPNAGHPMSAMAGALNVKLEKVGHYTLGDPQQPPKSEDIRGAVRLMRIAVAMVTGLLVSILLAAGVVKRRTCR